MSLPVNNKNSGKPGSKGLKGGLQGSKFIAKPGAKAAGANKKPIKTELFDYETTLSGLTQTPF